MSDRARWILIGVAVLFAVIAVFAGGFHCAGVFNPPQPQPVGIDAGPGLEDIAQREQEAEEAARVELERIEAKRQEDLENLTEAQRREYEEIRNEGPEAVLVWLNEFDRAHFGARSPR